MMMKLYKKKKLPQTKQIIIKRMRIKFERLKNGRGEI
jgi:hypothetical protein